MEYKVYRLLLIGDSGVGKSAILNRFSDNIFIKDCTTTIGVDFRIKTFKIDNDTIKVELWDTTGNKTFRDIVKIFYKRTNCVVFIYDITEHNSFKNIKKWLKESDLYAPKNVKKIIVGNKLDLENLRQVDYKESLDFAHKLNIDYIETSAKNNSNINELFSYITENLLTKQDGIQLSSPKQKNRKTNKHFLKPTICTFVPSCFCNVKTITVDRILPQ